MSKNMLASQHKAKPDIENKRGFNMAGIKLTTVEVTKLQL
jgi:hypothetical protein